MIKHMMKIGLFIICIVLLLTLWGCYSDGGDSDSIIWGRALSVGTSEPVANLRFSLDGLNIFGATDSTGYFRIDVPLASGSYTARFARHGELISTLEFGVTDLQAQDGATIQLTWPEVAAGEASISGAVTDQDGAPLGGVEIIVGRPDENILLAHTDEFGAYAFTSLPGAGGYVVIASFEGFLPDSVSLALNPDAPDRVNFQLEPVPTPSLPHGSVKGHVTDENGTDMPGAYITIYPYNSLTPLYDTTGETVTALDGTFEFAEIIEGPYVLWIGKAGHGVKAREIYVTAGIAWEGETVLDGKYLIEP